MKNKILKDEKKNKIPQKTKEKKENKNKKRTTKKL
jgi:hypothetical protein